MHAKQFDRSEKHKKTFDLISLVVFSETNTKAKIERGFKNQIYLEKKIECRNKT